MIDSVYKKDKNYCPQVFLEEIKYVVKEKKKSNFITDDIEISPNDSDKKILIKKILMKKIKYRISFWRKYKKVSGSASSLLKYQKFFKLGAQNIKSFLEVSVSVFYSSSLG